MVSDDKLSMLEIERLTHGGRGIGRIDGKAVFVPLSAPGDRLSIRILERHQRYDVAEIVEILRPSLQRVVPRCPVYGPCGGCNLMHVDATGQLAAKQEVLEDNLRRIGGLATIPPIRIIPTTPWTYRNRLKLRLRSNGEIGIFERKRDGIQSVSGCLIADSRIDQQLALIAGWPERKRLSDQTGIESVCLRVGDLGEAGIAVWEGEQPTIGLILSAVNDLERYCRRTSPAVAPFRHVICRRDRVVWPDDSVRLRITVGNRPFEIGPLDFFQVNGWGAEQLVAAVCEQLAAQPVDCLVDLFCGVGFFSLCCADLVEEVFGADLMESSIAAARQNSEQLKIRHASFDVVDLVHPERAWVERLSTVCRHRRAMILVDPPRRGLSPQLIDGLATVGTMPMIYVSCDPATFARDLARLRAKGIRLRSLCAIDLFPQTDHFELIACLDRG